jgi:cell wall-associated NlpC family hydrolase
VALTGCSSTPPRADSRPGTPRTWPDAPVADTASRLTLEQAHDVTLRAISLVGTPYRYGGNTPESGFDCSGLIGYVYRSMAGIAAPRTVAALTGWGQQVTQQALRTGDLVVFTQRGVAGHAGIYVGQGRFVHAPSKGGEVRLDALDATYWARQQVSYRRP